MAYSLVLQVKGTSKAARRAAARRGIPLKSCLYDPKWQTSHCVASCKLAVQRRAMSWYSEAEGKARKGRGFAPGTLLNFGGCRGGDYVSR